MSQNIQIHNKLPLDPQDPGVISDWRLRTLGVLS